MCKDLQQVHWGYNILSTLGDWALLAGYLVLPGTFTTLQNSGFINQGLSSSDVGTAVLTTIQNPPMLAIALSLLGTGLGTIAFLFWKKQRNYIWLLNKLFE